MKDSDYYAMGYSQSHAEDGYGERYKRTYETGYYAIEWAEAERELLIACLKEVGAEGRSCLDFACGTGRISRAAAAVCSDVVGVDISEAMLGAAKTVPGMRLELRDIISAPHAQQFDVATAFRFFLNAEPSLRERAMGALAAHLKDGGYLVANVHMNAASPVGRLYGFRNRVLNRVHNRTLRLEEFAALAQRHGFTIEKVHWYGFLPRLGRLRYPGMRTAYRLFEALGRRVPAVAPHLAQSFICVMRKRHITAE